MDGWMDGRMEGRWEEGGKREKERERECVCACVCARRQGLQAHFHPRLAPSTQSRMHLPHKTGQLGAKHRCDWETEINGG
jgi:hypothetical protein